MNSFRHLKIKRILLKYYMRNLHISVLASRIKKLFFSFASLSHIKPFCLKRQLLTYKWVKLNLSTDDIFRPKLLITWSYGISWKVVDCTGFDFTCIKQAWLVTKINTWNIFYFDNNQKNIKNTDWYMLKYSAYILNISGIYFSECYWKIWI